MTASTISASGGIVGCTCCWGNEAYRKPPETEKGHGPNPCLIAPLLTTLTQHTLTTTPDTHHTTNNNESKHETESRHSTP